MYIFGLDSSLQSSPENDLDHNARSNSWAPASVLASQNKQNKMWSGEVSLHFCEVVATEFLQCLWTSLSEDAYYLTYHHQQQLRRIVSSHRSFWSLLCQPSLLLVRLFLLLWSNLSKVIPFCNWTCLRWLAPLGHSPAFSVWAIWAQNQE